MAANYRHIGGGENRLGRHYSRFSAFWPPAAPADQSLALRKSQNAGSNRRSRARRLVGAHLATAEEDDREGRDFSLFAMIAPAC